MELIDVAFADVRGDKLGASDVYRLRKQRRGDALDAVSLPELAKPQRETRVIVLGMEPPASLSSGV